MLGLEAVEEGTEAVGRFLCWYSVMTERRSLGWRVGRA